MKRIHSTRNKKTAEPAIDIVAARIAALRSPHGHLTAFIRSKGYPVSTAWVAMQGKLNGPKARIIVEDVKREFGI
ncbi:MAG TPA: hypothetical protein DCY07_00295 [Rhodospirillaceae bacterium]|nr:hypothetical protein [Rhodospirillaceae bacterium]